MSTEKGLFFHRPAEALIEVVRCLYQYYFDLFLIKNEKIESLT
ncbi:hypothetical protein MPR_2109 [Myroides profundi]|nr:hypothetical protein MPR_2109 [Myroides profundi]